MAQSSEKVRLSPLRSCVQFSLRTHDTYVKRVNALLGLAPNWD